jgi:hypothetical protein
MVGGIVVLLFSFFCLCIISHINFPCLKITQFRVCKQILNKPAAGGIQGGTPWRLSWSLLGARQEVTKNAFTERAKLGEAVGEEVCYTYFRMYFQHFFFFCVRMDPKATSRGIYD